MRTESRCAKMIDKPKSSAFVSHGVTHVEISVDFGGCVKSEMSNNIDFIDKSLAMVAQKWPYVSINQAKLTICAQFLSKTEHQLFAKKPPG